MTQIAVPPTPRSPAPNYDAPALRKRGFLDEVRAQLHHYGLFGVLVIILSALMLYPVFTLIRTGFYSNDHLSGEWFKNVLSNRTFLSNLLNSLWLAVVVTFLCNLISFPLALLNQKYSFKGKGFFSAMVLVPMVLPPFVGAIGMKQMLGKFGSLTIFLQHLGIFAPDHGVNWLREGGFWACAILIALGLYPIAYLNLQAALANIDPAMLEAAENLGGRRFHNFRKITLPLAMPGIFAGSTIIFIWAFTELGTPLLLDYPYVASRDLWDSLATATGGGDGEAAAKAVIILSIAVVAYLVGKFVFGRQGFAMTSKAAVAATTKKLGWGGSLLVIIPFTIVTLLAMLPHLGVVLYSFTAIATEKGAGWGQEGVFGWTRSVFPFRFTTAGYQSIFTIPEIYGSIFNSLKYASVSTFFDIILGLSIAWVLVRTKVWGRSGLDALAMLSLAVPGLIMAFGFINVSYHWPFPSPADNGGKPYYVINPMLFLVIAYTVRRLPYLVRSAAGGLQQTSVTLEEAAANLGASPWTVLRRVTIPLIMANLIAGALLTFAFALLEVSDSLILAQLKTSYPITKMIYQLGSDTSAADNVRNACALGVLAMGFLIVAILTAGTLMGKKLGAVFRA